jgi:UDP-N-acetylglucosamine 2-epimerase (non-hydrolysing)
MGIKPKKVTHIVGARPNFMKAAPVLGALNHQGGIAQTLIHTGQHYDANMSDVFFQQLGMPHPDFNLGVGSGTHTTQTAEIMVRTEKVLLDDKPDLVLVYGDVNSTVAAALVCAKDRIPIGHVEAGLRSFDRSMPEEINRLITDQIADILFTPSQDGDQNLLREGVSSEKIKFVGNVMIDTLVRLLPQAQIPPGLKLEKPYALVTLHRPSNVDTRDSLDLIVNALVALSQQVQIIFPVHPRTRNRINESGLKLPGNNRFMLLDPLGYLEFLALQRAAAVVITDSGGIQEETTYLGVPCLTLRKNTERPITIEYGTNQLLGHDMARLTEETNRILTGCAKQRRVPPLWDGKASERIAAIVHTFLN